MKEEVREKLMKLLALAQRGVGGEAVNARKMLEEALWRTGTVIDDLDDSRTARQLWAYKDVYEGRLLTQIVATVCGHAVRIGKLVGRKQIGTECTPSQRVEIDMLYNAHRKQLRKDMEDFFNAYLNRQDLFPRDMPNPEKRTLTDEERKRMEKIMRFMAGIDRVQARKEIGVKG